MVLPIVRRFVGTLGTQSVRCLHRTVPVAHIKNYDKKRLLEAEDVEYKFDDKQFLRGPSFADEPYIKPTDDEMVELTRLKLEDEIAREQITKVDPLAAPFNEVLEGHEDGGKFTQTEVIPDNDARWFWVERLMPKNLLDQPIREGSELIAPLPKEPPKLPYFVARTRSRLYPLYRNYEIIGRNNRTYWRNRWDGLFNKYHTDILENLESIKWENNEKTIVVTEINKVQGDIWKLEDDARKFLESKHPDGGHILSAVNEVRGSVRYKGDFVKELHEFLRTQGF